MKSGKRILCICCVLLFLCFVVLSSFEVAHAAGHACVGGACPVCACLSALQALLYRVCVCCALVCVLSACAEVLRRTCVILFVTRRQYSPVLLKVKLLN